MVTVEMCPYLQEVCQTQSLYESLVSIRREGCLDRKREDHQEQKEQVSDNILFWSEEHGHDDPQQHPQSSFVGVCQHLPSSVSICLTLSASINICNFLPGYIILYKPLSVYVSIYQPLSSSVSICCPDLSVRLLLPPVWLIAIHSPEAWVEIGLSGNVLVLRVLLVLRTGRIWGGKEILS